MKVEKFGITQVWLLVWFPPLLAAAIYLAQIAMGLRSSWWQLWLIALFATLAGILVRGLNVEDVDSSLPTHVVRSNGLVDRPFAEVARWENRLSWGQNDVRRFNRAVRMRMKDLADERLRLRHGIDCRTHPATAQKILGQEAFAFVTRPSRSVPDPHFLSFVVTRIEEI